MKAYFKKNSLKILHLSTIPVWVLKNDSGMPSVMKTLQFYDELGYEQLYIYPYETNRVSFFGKKCRVVSIKIPKIFLNQKILKSYHIFNKLRFLYFMTFYTLKIKNLIKDFSPDLVYAHLQYMPLTAFSIFKRKKPIFVRYYGTLNIYEYLKKRKFYKFEENLLSFRLNLTGYILVNDGTASDMVAEKRGLKKEKIFFSINGIEKFKNMSTSERESLKENLGLKGKYILLFLNRLNRLKGTDLFIKFIEKLQNVSDISYLIIGDGEDRERLLNFLKSKRIEYRYLGSVKQNETYKYYQISDLFLNFNIISSLNNPVLESIRNKTPVLNLKRGYNIDFLHKTLYTFEDINGMVDFAKKFIEDLKKENENILADKERLKEFESKYLITWEERMKKEYEFIQKRLKNV